MFIIHNYIFHDHDLVLVLANLHVKYLQQNKTNKKHDKCEI